MSDEVAAAESGTQPAAAGRSRGILGSSAVIASGTLVSRVLGFVSLVVLAQTIGSLGTGANTFALANQLPNNIAIIIAAGLFNAGRRHRLRRHARRRGSPVHQPAGDARHRRLPRHRGSGHPGGPRPRVPLRGPGAGDRGFSDQDLALATAFAYWCLPQVLFYALYSLLGEVLNTKVDVRRGCLTAYSSTERVVWDFTLLQVRS